jgi:hypothetical protein
VIVDEVLVIEQVIYTMDKCFDATFGDWIRDPVNLPLALPHLLRIGQDYKNDIVALINVVNYMSIDWSLQNIIILMRVFLNELVPKDQIGSFIGKFIGSFHVAAQVFILEGLGYQTFPILVWKDIFGISANNLPCDENTWDFCSASLLLGNLFEKPYSSRLLKLIYS